MDLKQLGPDAEGQILAAFFNASEDAIIIKDLTGRILSWNPGAERMYGYSAAEMIGASIVRIVPPDYTDEYARIMSRVDQGERFDLVDTVRVTKSGVRIEISLSVWPIFNEKRETVAACVTARDTSAQRRAEHGQRSSEARWRAIIESAADGIVTIDRRGRIEFFNPAAEHLFGYQRDEVVGRNVSLLMPSPYSDEHDHYLKRYQMTGERHIIGIGREVVGRRRDGTTFPLHLSVGEFSLDGETKFTGIIRDLTERVRLEKKLFEESGLVSIGELAAVLAHEVKNPLAAVSGAIQMLSEHLSGDDDREIVQEILRRLDGLSSLMTDLLLFARPPRPQTRALELAGLLHALVAFVKADPAWADVDVTIDSLDGTVIADPELLKMAFQNLLLNAMQALRGQQQRSVRVTMGQAGGEMVVDITDSGPGIPSEYQERLFTPFFTTKSRGTGLGLATVRRIAEAHGGRVVIHTTGPEGTTVRVTLPSGSTA